MDALVQEAIEWLQGRSDAELIELLMTGFIPDDYEENKDMEKKFTKLIEIVIAECFERIGFDSTICKTKSETEDVQIKLGNTVILVDAKTFRLGRSQVAPNVKDFVKLSTIEKWVGNYNRTNPSTAVGALIVYPSTHEWKKHSEAYKECSNKRLPVVMLPFEIIAYLLQQKTSYSPTELFSLWHYKSIYPTPVSTKIEYWSKMLPLLAKAVKRKPCQVEQDLDILRLYYAESVSEAKRSLYQKIETSSKNIPNRVKEMSEEEARSLLESLLIQVETSPLLNSIENIDQHRKEYLSTA